MTFCEWTLCLQVFTEKKKHQSKYILCNAQDLKISIYVRTIFNTVSNKNWYTKIFVPVILEEDYLLNFKSFFKAYTVINLELEIKISC